jgi:hypothetical protein
VGSGCCRGAWPTPSCGPWSPAATSSSMVARPDGERRPVSGI